MPTIDDEERDEKPLDPAVEKVRRKMVRLLAVSIGIMLVGVMAVLAVIVYRVTQPATTGSQIATADRFQSGANDLPIEPEAMLPDGFTVEQVALDGGRILFFGRNAEGALRALVYDMAAGDILADIAVRN